MNAQYAIGDEVTCNDGPCGKLTRVIVNPVNRTLTHLVVEPGRHPDDARLVPVDLVEAGAAPGRGIALRCDSAAFDGFEYAQESDFLPSEQDEFGYTSDQVRFMPFFPLGGGMGGGGTMAPAAGMLGAHQPTEPRVVSHDRVPAGEVQIRRGQQVHAADGDIGKVQGLVIDPADDRVTHVLLQEGHLWGKKDVAIPIDAVSSVRDGIHLNLSKDDVRDLPQVEIGRH